MFWKRLVGIILLVVGALSSILGTAGLERDLSSAESSTELMPLEIGVLLIGLVPGFLLDIASDAVPVLVGG